jgi:hypothetical protein
MTAVFKAESLCGLLDDVGLWNFEIATAVSKVDSRCELLDVDGRWVVVEIATAVLWGLLDVITDWRNDVDVEDVVDLTTAALKFELLLGLFRRIFGLFDGFADWSWDVDQISNVGGSDSSFRFIVCLFVCLFVLMMKGFSLYFLKIVISYYEFNLWHQIPLLVWLAVWIAKEVVLPSVCVCVGGGGGRAKVKLSWVINSRGFA